MDDMTQFEERFEERLRAFVRTGVQSVDSAAVARAVAVGHPKSTATRPAVRWLGGENHRPRLRTVIGPWRSRSMIGTAFGAVAAVVVLVVGGAFFVIQRGQPGIGGPSATPTATPSPTPARPNPTPTPFIVPGGRAWTVTVRNESSDPTTWFVAEAETETGMGRQCGTVTPSVVPPDTTMTVTFLLPPKTVTSCWIWVDPDPGGGGSFFQTSDAPMEGEFLITADGQTMWGGQ